MINKLKSLKKAAKKIPWQNQDICRNLELIQDCLLNWCETIAKQTEMSKGLPKTTISQMVKKVNLEEERIDFEKCEEEEEEEEQEIAISKSSFYLNKL